MKRFYCCYVQECGFGAAMQCHGVIEAENWQDAHKNWVSRMVCRSDGRHFTVNPAFPDVNDGLEALFEIPTEMKGWTEEQILAHYHDIDTTNQWVAPEK